MRTPWQHPFFVRTFSALILLVLTGFVMGISSCSTDPQNYCSSGYLNSSETKECVKYCGNTFKHKEQKSWCEVGQFLFLTKKALNSTDEKAALDTAEKEVRDACQFFVDEQMKQAVAGESTSDAQLKKKDPADLRRLHVACYAGAEAEKIRTFYEKRNTAQGPDRETGNNR